MIQCALRARRNVQQLLQGLLTKSITTTMSPLLLENELNIERVAVIGAGPGGLAAAKYAFASRMNPK